MTTENTIVNESTQELINTNLQTALAQVIDKTMQGVDASVSFLQQEIPDVIHQLLLWYGVKSAFTASLIVLLLVIVHYAIYRGVKLAVSFYKDYHNNEAYWATIIVSGVGTILAYPILLIESLNPMYNNLLTAVQIWIAPKIFLLDYASSFVK